jgi:hypothetical protein
MWQYPLLPRYTRRMAVVVCLVVISLLIPSLAAPASAQENFGTLSGTVYRDFDNDSTRDTREPGIAGITVNALDQFGVTASATTAANGSYSLPGLNGYTRVEYILPASLNYLQSAAAGGTSVQFIYIGASATVTLNTGFFNPSDFTGVNPRIATAIFRRADNTGVTDSTIEDYLVSADGTFGNVATHEVTDGNTTGTVFGLAYQRSTNRLYSGAYIRRGASLGSTDNTGAIYRTTTPTGTPNTALLINLNTVAGINTGTNPHPKGVSGFNWNVDGNAYAAVGKIGLGDLEISDDDTRLYAVNLNQRSVVVIPFQSDLTTVNTAGITQVTIPADTTNCGASVGVMRPFGLKFHDGFLYVGAVCTAEATGTSASNLRAYIYQFNPTTNAFVTTPVLTFQLNYPRRHVNDSFGTTSSTSTTDGEWQPWRDTWRPTGCFGCPDDLWAYPQPILTDIEFDGEGFMMIGLRDRLADQAFHQDDPGPNNGTLRDTRNGGDLLLACLVSGTWTLENAGACNGRTTSDTLSDTGEANRGSGPGQREFYWEDQYELDYNPDYHRDTEMGSLAVVKGSGEIVTTFYDVFATFETGTIVMDNDNGERMRGVQLIAPDSVFGKSGGIGDTELLAARAPVEVGNRVWRDTDGDGIQDPNEPALAGVSVQLLRGTTVLSPVVTDLNGNFIFSSDATRTDRLGADYGLALTYGEALTIRIDPTAGQNANALSGMALTIANNDGTTNGDLRDSDATINSGNAEIAINLGGAGQNNHTYDIGYAPLGSIGNRVWLDEDSNGYQDEGEDGIPNVTVQLKNSGGTVIATTVTDSNGYYIFKNLLGGTYFVQVLGSSVPTGLSQTTIYPSAGADETNQNQSTGNGYQVVLPSGGENLTADFGYNWNPTADVNNGTNTAAIGDCVWYDADGDGAQDPEEAGIAGVTVQLITAGSDGLFGTSDDVVSATTTTSNTGCYLFDGLTPGAYVVRIPTPPANTTQTGDPDHWGTTGANDNQTTVPVVLAPGDVFLDADFGYQLTANNFGSIGDTIWLDLDADDTGPTNAPGGGDAEAYIPNVTVALIRDLDNDGVWDAGEPIIASDVTDANGFYLFPGLPIDNGTGTDDYLVLVTDGFNALRGLTQTFDHDGAQTDGLSRVADLGTTAVLTEDFGYVPDNSGTSGAANTTLPMSTGVEAAGRIGDRVWLDIDSGDDQDANEPGIPNVEVTLNCRGLDDTSGTADDLILTTLTGENGYYLFDNIPVDAGGNQCVVTVNTATLPSGLAQTFDASGSQTDSSSTVTINTGTPVNLTQDFGYVGTGTVGNLVWRDTNADGINNGANGPDGTAGTDDDEPGIVGVTLTIWYDRNANGIIDGTDIPLGTQTTTTGGAYLFSGLSVDDGGGNAQYIVDVTDTAGLLGGYWHSLGTAGTNDHSQNDPYAVTITTGAPNNLTADFGYYVRGAAIGNRVWRDTNNNGLQDTGEPSIPGTIVTLTIVYPSGAGTTTLYAATNSAGYYSFGNLLLDEDHNGVVAPEPTFTVSVNSNQVALAGLLPAIVDVGSNGTDLRDSDNHAGVVASPIEGRVTVPVVSTDPATENVIASYDFGYVIPGAIGNKVWIDEDSNGVQDEGEDGIPNVTVNLYNSAGTVIATTTTNTNGEYLFKNLPAGSYFVRVDGATIPTGMSQTTIYPSAGNDLVNQDQSTGANDYGYPITLGVGQVNLTADFGYNWNPTGDVNTPGAATTAALGDHVWVDSDGDGAQDPEEVGIPGATLQIVTAGPDNVFGTGDDVLGATTTTNATGYYIFDGLTPGAYVVQVVSLPAGYGSYTQTGDPDHFGTTGANDGRTTAPVILGPGDVFLNADFGYQPPAGATGSIGDTIWLDINANGVGPANTPTGTDTTEPYIAGVSVSLIRDLNQNGVRDAGEPIIATDVTDANGFYLFTGLPITDGTGTDDYIVFVDDSTNRLQGLTQTYDANGIATPNISAVANLTATAVLTQDFGYTYDSSGTGGSNTTTAPLPGAAEQPGRIGDRVWLDLDSDDTQDANEPGLVGVTVTLTSNGPDGAPGGGDDISLTTVTGANGVYLFDNLPVSAGGIAYTIQVVTSSLPGVLTQTYDATNPQTDSTSTVSLTTAAPVNLNQDFGYVGVGQVGNLVWNDVNGDGNVDAGENGFANVTLAIYWDSNNNGQLDPNDRFINTTTTDGAGAYLFTGLSVNDGTGNNIQYIVDVTDQNGVLAGYHHTLGTANTNDNSQDDDGYMVLLSTGTTSNLTADFGYEQQPAAVGNRVWADDNNNGLQDTGEPGISGIVVNLTIAYPGGGSVTVSTITNNDGYYSFANLLLDEDYNGDGVAPEPTFTITVNTAQANLTGYTVTIIDVSSNGQDLRDSDNPAGVVAQATEGLSTIPTTPTDPTTEPVRASYDFGFVSTMDYGDLPTTYSNIRLTNNGARHVIGAVRLGTLVDADGDGAPTANATGDDTLDLNDDEDGAIKTPGSIWAAGGTGQLNITVSGGTGCVAAWIDWNRDNDFADTGERIFVDQSITNATQTVTFPIPASATFPAGQVLNLRVRLYSTCTAGAAAPTGLASGIGEVEDHQLDSAPLAVVMESFEAQCRPTDILAAWATSSETNILGFNLWRGTTDGAPDTQINTDLIPSQSPGGGQGAIYEFADATVQEGNTYFYWLDALDMNGTTTRFGPVSSTFPCTPTAVTVASVQVVPATTTNDLLALAALGLLAVGALGGLLRRR